MGNCLNWKIDRNVKTFNIRKFVTRSICQAESSRYLDSSSVCQAQASRYLDSSSESMVIRTQMKSHERSFFMLNSTETGFVINPNMLKIFIKYASLLLILSAFLSNMLKSVVNPVAVDSPLLGAKNVDELRDTLDVMKLNLNMLKFQMTPCIFSYSLGKFYLDPNEFNFSKYLNAMISELKSYSHEAKKSRDLHYLSHTYIGMSFISIFQNLAKGPFLSKCYFFAILVPILHLFISMVRIRHKTSFNNNMTCNEFGIQRITSLKEMKTFFVPSVVGQATGGLTSVVQTNILEGMDECCHFKLGNLLKVLSIHEGSEVGIPIVPTNQIIYLKGYIGQGIPRLKVLSNSPDVLAGRHLTQTAKCDVTHRLAMTVFAFCASASFHSDQITFTTLIISGSNGMAWNTKYRIILALI